MAAVVESSTAEISAIEKLCAVRAQLGDEIVDACISIPAELALYGVRRHRKVLHAGGADKPDIALRVDANGAYRLVAIREALLVFDMSADHGRIQHFRKVGAEAGECSYGVRLGAVETSVAQREGFLISI